MLKVAITTAVFRPDHPKRVMMLIDAGFDYVHIRYPDESFESLRSLVTAVGNEYRDRLTLHDYIACASDLGVGGIHLNRRNNSIPAGWKGRVSRSCHSVDEIIHVGSTYDYVTLSPVFPSVSKPGYGDESRLLLKSYESVKLNSRVIALGGVTPDNAEEVVSAGFDGYAMLGSLGWDMPIDQFKNNILKCCNL